MIPRATYRLQFHSRFTFQDAAKLVPYLASLGISHVYASPILEARRGSVHGYDVVDHSVISDERGGTGGFLELGAALRARGLGLILDIVPNHMAVGDADNRWWLDVLEHGRHSVYAECFDIDWECEDPRLRNRILAPFLSTTYADALSSGAIRLLFDERLEKLAFAHFEHRFPLRPEDYALVVGRAQRPVDADLSAFNSPQALHGLLQNQHFVLCSWRSAHDRLNWRRFFDITQLAGLKVERDDVFDAVHAVAFDLFQRGLIDGVRVDHIDGLADPGGYCRKLRQRLAEMGSRGGRDEGPPYIVVEKILAHAETLPGDWAVDGTTGYDFMHQISALQHAEEGKQDLDRLWRAVSRTDHEFEAVECEARKEMLANAFCGQALSCAAAFADAAATTPLSNDMSAPLLQRALVRLIVHLRRYRVYANGAGPAPLPDDVSWAFEAAKAGAADDELLALASIAQVVEGSGGADAHLARRATARFNQLSASVAAKAVEDTAFYRYGRLLSRNEVGSDPRVFAIAGSEFHERTLRRSTTQPHAMLTTATHDHKRGEDFRARLAVVSEIPELWASAVAEWFDLTGHDRTPDIGDADVHMLFQTLVGAWPIGLRSTDAASLRRLADRVGAWLQKALRESKRRTSWTAIDEAYEAQNEQFLRSILDPLRARAFLDSLAAFVERIASAGASNSLVQCALRCTLPGVPDLYQGNEFWDFSLVDPDNRRAVDFDRLEGALTSLDPNSAVESSADNWRDGRLKLQLLSRLLNLRAAQPELFALGAYRPLQIEGHRSGNVLAFARERANKLAIAVTALHCARVLVGTESLAPSQEWWGDTVVCLDAFRGRSARRWLLGKDAALPDSLRVADCLSRLPTELYLVN
jgi:(1->4)-alpha-D-glucan 1-alpha-D-glucosylmutase